MRKSSADVTTSPMTMYQSTEYIPQNMIILSRITSWATGMMMNDASRLAARTEVVREEITTAPATITRACAVVRRPPAAGQAAPSTDRASLSPLLNTGATNDQLLPGVRCMLLSGVTSGGSSDGRSRSPANDSRR
jgi:hypothetical protein